MNEQDLEQDYILVFEAPKIEKPEFRLYYDSQGKVLFYTCEKPEGNYIIVDAVTFAAARPDVRVVDGKLSTVNTNLVIAKLMPDQYEGIECAYEDISIVLDSNDKVTKQKWKLNVYELNG
jgi:hypothetical protein